MASAFTPRQAWVSTGIRLQTAASQRPPCISNVRSTLRHRNLSVSPIKHEESNQGSRILRSNQDVSVQEPSREVDEVNVAVSAGKSEEGKPPKPHSLKDIFPDLFGDRKPLMAHSSSSGSRKDWEKSLDASMRDPNAMIRHTRQPSRPSPAAIKSQLSSIFQQESPDVEESAMRSNITKLGAKNRTRAAPKELQAFHELLESMFEASEAQAAESGRMSRTAQTPNDSQRDNSGFAMNRFTGGRDAYLSDAMAGRRYTERREHGAQPYDQKSTPWITPTAKRVGGLRTVTDAEMEDYMQKRELVASLRTDLDILEWLNRTYFGVNAAASISADASDNDAPLSSTFTASYPLVLAYTISVLHLRFRNPHAALAVFEVARSFSLESYLVGCTTAVYNEMLRARWEGLQDLKGVEEGLQEMQNRGVGWDKETMRFATTLVEQLVEARLASLEREQASTPPTAISNDQRLVWAHGPDVFQRLVRLEEMVENQVEFTELRERRKMRRRADEVREQAEGGMWGGQSGQQDGQGRGFNGHSATY
ncbi:hypothetical protein NliqN6_0963 [Naganishia liquefaciens]|uniref:Mtf2-like C-terminal domain-containing protein n=1 Tax=Naganishia liquefaciens TaxID=104408 RepID=A0A8H3TPJ2_9TREE|nr:hypothetical protein NliqN6_0963 [Naganishia liquefaciens]